MLGIDAAQAIIKQVVVTYESGSITHLAYKGPIRWRCKALTHPANMADSPLRNSFGKMQQIQKDL